MDKLKKYFVKVLPVTVATILILSIFLIPLWLALVTETDINNYFILKKD